MLYRIHYSHRTRRYASSCTVEAISAEEAQRDFEETATHLRFRSVQEETEETAKHKLSKDWGKDLTAEDMGLVIYRTSEDPGMCCGEGGFWRIDTAGLRWDPCLGCSGCALLQPEEE